MLIAIDFETYLIDKDNIFPKPVCLSSYDGENALLHRKDEMVKFLDYALNAHTIIAHNAVFECGVILKHFPELTEKLLDALDSGRIICTKINEKLLDILREKPINKATLSHLVQHYFDTDISAGKGEDAWRMRYAELEDIEDWPQEAIDYAIDDSIWAYKVCQSQDPVKSELAVRSAVYLNIMGSTGIKISSDRVNTLKNEILEYLKPRYEYLIDLGYCVPVKDKDCPRKQMKKLREYVETLEIQKRHTKKGAISTDGESLEYYMSQTDDKILNTFAEIAVYEKVLTAYISHMSNTDIIFTQYSTTKSTGRTSASGTSLFPSLNIQQMPRKVPGVSYDVRNCFVPRDGFKLLSIDYAGLELCSTAHQLYKLYGHSSMRDMLNSGDEPTDMHSRLAARLNKMSYEDFMARKAEFKDVRQKAKPINLGFPGGIGYDTMRTLLWRDGIKTYYKILHTEKNKRELWYYQHQLSAPDLRIARIKKDEYALVQDELVTLKREFFNLYPELEIFLKETHNRFLDGNVKYIKNEFDEWEEEPMYSYDIYGHKRAWCTYTALCNGYLMQTPSAIGAKRAVSRIMRETYNNKAIKPLAFIHDEVVFEILESRTDLVEDMANIMIEEMKTVLDSVRITVEASMMDQWQKEDGFWTKQFWR